MLMENLRGVPGFVLVLAAMIIVTSSAAVATFAINQVTTTFSFTAQTLSDDLTVTVENQEVYVSDVATASSPVEANNPLATGRTALVQGNLAFRFDVRETTAQDWGATRTYDVQVYNGETSLGIISITNSTDNDAVNPEGVTVSVDLQSATVVPDNLTIRVDRTAD